MSDEPLLPPAVGDRLSVVELSAEEARRDAMVHPHSPARSRLAVTRLPAAGISTGRSPETALPLFPISAAKLWSTQSEARAADRWPNPKTA